MSAASGEGSSFTYDALPGRVVFRRGGARQELDAEVARLGAARIMLIVAPQESDLARELVATFEHRIAVTFDQVEPHVPQQLAQRAREVAERHSVDCLLSIGGGSTTGAAKIVALESKLPIIAVPTTYAGSEMTPVWGMTADGNKVTGRSDAVMPRVVVYDPELLETLPHEFAMASALNAMAHCVEALWTPQSNPITQAVALQGVVALAAGLRGPSSSQESTDNLLLGAYLAGASFAVAGSGLHHKICHALGGGFNLSHAETHAAVLPHVLAFNAPALPQLMDRLATALSAADAVDGLRALYVLAGAAMTLESAGLREEQLDEATALVSQKLPIANPRQVLPDDIRHILSAAYQGRPGHE